MVLRNQHGGRLIQMRLGDMMPNGNSQQIYPYLAEIMAAQQALVMGLERVVAVAGAAHIPDHLDHPGHLDMAVVLEGLLVQMRI